MLLFFLPFLPRHGKVRLVRLSFTVLSRRGTSLPHTATRHSNASFGIPIWSGLHMQGRCGTFCCRSFVKVRARAIPLAWISRANRTYTVVLVGIIPTRYSAKVFACAFCRWAVCPIDNVIITPIDNTEKPLIFCLTSFFGVGVFSRRDYYNPNTRTPKNSYFLSL